jgi:hypothetical protein
MSATSISKFATTSATSATPSTYNYVLIETAKPIKLNASFSAGSKTIKTCAGGTVSSNGSTGAGLIESVTVSDMSTCTQGLMTFGSMGGGKWFKLQTPITISSDKTYSLDLAFNAEKAIAGGLYNSFNGAQTYVDTNDYAMNYPWLSISPVLRESTKETIREEYTIAMTDLGGSLVVDLYYAGSASDVGTADIVGAQTRFVLGSTETTLFVAPTPYSVTKSGSSISISDYSGAAIISGLVRSTTGTAGGTQSVSVDKTNFSYEGGNGASASGTTTYTATFNGLLTM